MSQISLHTVTTPPDPIQLAEEYLSEGCLTEPFCSECVVARALLETHRLLQSRTAGLLAAKTLIRRLQEEAQND